MKRVIILTIALLMLIRTGLSVAQPEALQFSAQDRVLVLAPHPDDELIGAGGAIQRALKAGALVKVVLMTNGENNELSFIVYKKRPVLTRRDLLAMGEVRHNESLAALASLGLNKENVVALGYPDFGMMEIMTKYWGNTKPLRSMLSRVRQVPYADSLSPGAPYVGDSVLRDLKSIILSYKPTKIFVSHPADVNRDHRALYLFLKIALWELEGRIDDPQVLPFLVHVVRWPTPQGYHPELPLTCPQELQQSQISWTRLDLEPNEVDRKYFAIKKYVSQIKYAPNYLVTFNRKNELFGDYSPLRVPRQMASEVQFQNVNSVVALVGNGSRKKQEHITTLGYARQGDDLLVRLDLKQEIEKELGVSLLLLGYSRDVPFSQLPKIIIEVNAAGLSVMNKNHRLQSKEVNYTSEGSVLSFRIPLSLLGRPQRVLSSARTSIHDLTLDETSWRVLEFD